MTDRPTLAALVDALGGARVLCVGDIMLDRFVYGAVERISPEAPIPVLHVEHEANMLGGAGNVVRNLAALGAGGTLVAAVADDPAGRDVRDLVAAEGGIGATLVTVGDRDTAIKTRYLAGTQQMMRADRETVAPLSPADAARIVEAATAAMADCAVVVLSDYGKGVLCDAVVEPLLAAAKKAGRPVIVDPKGRDFGRYRGAFLVAPNRRELSDAAGMAVDGGEAVIAAARHVIETSGIETVLATLSADGMILIRGTGDPTVLAAEARDVFDVSGAGDTVVAALAAGLAAGADLDDAAALANVAAGIVVGKVGTAVAYSGDVAAALHHQDLSGAEAKVMPIGPALDRVRVWRQQGYRVGFTNGCFDLLHPGHVMLLAKARQACDRLVVGLNSDSSTTRLKGDGRPVQGEAARAVVLASLASVDMVVVFAEDTPIDLIEAFRPEVLVKGADYTEEEVVGADRVREWDGDVVLVDLEPGHSTSATVARMAR
jgi:D-beta-D-heptose 7-phosphate kinase / D-beta-D-heptose 1-phosphate adenosyltransferase